MRTMVNETFYDEIVRDTSKIMEERQVATIDLKGYQNYLLQGNRLTLEKQYFERRRQLSTLALSISISANQPEVIEFLEEVIWEVCNEYTWALPAHLKLNPVEQTFDSSSPRMIDLFAAETAQTLSEIMELHEVLLSNQIKKESETKLKIEFFCLLKRKNGNGSG
ncbi:hypothetical protein LZ578_00340 [Jeotgalibaca sp. MA1X17-3]|uniref:hypothetical protein n=1 Tax=Jeotgalibaca sp. MA1X17-3 TaxID=2908211 RepID=UPI001F492686|nr:hypothetical protein [Jeotgalibaca sp. MA1X17-3]UJF15696.1 hypothetical protein LZ578_00340 [Jeotgalibaca sp. MA1X17-3]